MIGTRLGAYEVIAKLGEGGMGEVYRAKDLRLNRDVAIKVLPATFAEDPDRRARFDREAQAVAALSHPNVIAIFDTGVHEGKLYVVMELLTGATLRERLNAGALPIRKAVEVAVQIARGLGAAHGKGIVHRDLKPENIFLLDDGQVKILDFGLARQLIAGERTGATETMAVTDPGTVMGTIGYMAPEQVRGQAVDARADAFAFGAVLYEMVAGQRAFQRDTAADTMTALLTQDPPDLSGSRSDVSPALDRIIRHCLEKNANERFQSARDIAFALEALSGSHVSAGAAGDAVPAPLKPSSRWRWTVATTALVVAASGVTAWITTQASAEPADIRFEARTFESQWITNARFGPDGQSIIYSAASSGTTPSLYVVRAGDLAPQPIAGSGTHLLSVSSTGELAVLTGAVNTWQHRVFSGTLSRMTMNGAARPWMTGVTEADWSPDGATIAVIRENNGTWTLEYPAGKVLFTTTRGYLSDPRVSPDGKSVVFFDHSLLLDDRGWVKVVNQSGVVKTLAGEYWGEEGAAWSPDSQTVYFSAPIDAAQNYQLIGVNITGAPHPRRVLSSPGPLIGLDLSKDGRMLVISEDVRRALRVLVPGESVERELSWLNAPAGAFISRDGGHVAFNDTSLSAGKDYAVTWRDTKGSSPVRLGPGFPLSVSPDGKWIAAQVPSTGLPVFYPTGPGEPVSVSGFVMNAPVLVAQWFSDSRHALLCGVLGGNAAARCYRFDVRVNATPEPVTSEGTVGAVLGPDDRTLVVRMQDRTFRRSTIGGGTGTPVGFIQPDDTLLALSRDLTSVFVRKDAIPALVERIDLTTGKRSPVKAIGPPESSAVINVEVWDWQENGGYAYTYTRQLSQLFVVNGIRK
jgi:dipeptidyl aminopeptidase/acylaminoacyl peptidase